MLPSLHRLSISAKGDPALGRPSSLTPEFEIEQVMYDESGISQADAKAWWDRGEELGKGNFGEVRDVSFLRLRDSQSETTGKRVIIKRSRFDKMEAGAGEKEGTIVKEQIFQNQRIATREYWAHMEIWNRMEKAGTQRYITQPIPMKVPCQDDDLDLSDDEMVDAPQFIGANGSTNKRSRTPSPSPTTPSPSVPSTAPTFLLPSEFFESDSDSDSDMKAKHYPCTIDPETGSPIQHIFTIQTWACDEDSTLHTMADFFKMGSNYDKLKAVATEVGRALHALHDIKYVHGDLSPNNIIVCTKRGGGDVTIKLIDFGLSSKISVLDVAIVVELAMDKFRRLNELFKASSSFDKASPVDFYDCVRQAYAEADTSAAPQAAP